MVWYGMVPFLHSTLRWRQVRDSALRPLDGDRWWMEADSPWQCLAVCKDLTAALDSPDPYQYLSCLPVHQDGKGQSLAPVSRARKNVTIYSQEKKKRGLLLRIGNFFRHHES